MHCLFLSASVIQAHEHCSCWEKQQEKHSGHCWIPNILRPALPDVDTTFSTRSKLTLAVFSVWNCRSATRRQWLRAQMALMSSQQPGSHWSLMHPGLGCRRLSDRSKHLITNHYPKRKIFHFYLQSWHIQYSGSLLSKVLITTQIIINIQLLNPLLLS